MTIIVTIHRKVKKNNDFSEVVTEVIGSSVGHTYNHRSPLPYKTVTGRHLIM